MSKGGRGVPVVVSYAAPICSLIGGRVKYVLIGTSGPGLLCVRVSGSQFRGLGFRGRGLGLVHGRCCKDNLKCKIT